jgi:hypothetical protein
MANITASGPAPKKETVYNGPSPGANAGTVYNGPSATGGTVYNGPAPNAGSKSYSGPAAGALHSGSRSGTVYNPRQTTAQQQPAAGQHSGTAKASVFFFLIAGLSVLNTLLVLGHAPFVMALGLAVTRLFGPDAPMPNILFINVMAVGVLILLGVFVRHGSKAALLIGMLLYAGDTALFFIAGDTALHAPSIIVHVLLLIGMLRAFSQMEG